MSHWATPPIDREQVTLFAPTLDDSLDASHPVRLFEEMLRHLSFAEWESMYVRVAGQPPIHPRASPGAVAASRCCSFNEDKNAASMRYIAPRPFGDCTGLVPLR